MSFWAGRIGRGEHKFGGAFGRLAFSDWAAARKVVRLAVFVVAIRSQEFRAVEATNPLSFGDVHPKLVHDWSSTHLELLLVCSPQQYLNVLERCISTSKRMS